MFLLCKQGIFIYSKLINNKFNFPPFFKTKNEFLDKKKPFVYSPNDTKEQYFLFILILSFIKQFYLLFLFAFFYCSSCLIFLVSILSSFVITLIQYIYNNSAFLFQIFFALLFYCLKTLLLMLLTILYNMFIERK